MDTKKRIIGIGAGCLIVTGVIAGTIIWESSEKAPIAEATNNEKLQIADVASSDPETGEKVYVDSESQVVKELGEAGKLTVEGQKKPSFEITVNKVQKLKSCTIRGFGGEIKPENGTFLLLDVSAALDASATKAVDEEIAIMPLDASVFGVSPGENKNIRFDVSTTASYSCDVPNALDFAVGAGKTVKGQLMLDSPYSSGQVIYDPEKTGGWTWSY